MVEKMKHPDCRVMVVDDDEANLLLAKEVIQMYGGCPIVCNSSKAAHAHLQHSTVDLIFLDVHMPEMTGLELARNIRALEHRWKAQRCPIVALTASAMPHEIAACLEHGMDDVVLKPFAFETLKSMLDKWCHEETGHPT
jgi:CheY-like chemotaxis protein